MMNRANLGLLVWALAMAFGCIAFALLSKGMM